MVSSHNPMCFFFVKEGVGGVVPPPAAMNLLMDL